jgi:hypothetical protein
MLTVVRITCEGAKIVIIDEKFFRGHVQNRKAPKELQMKTTFTILISLMISASSFAFDDESSQSSNEIRKTIAEAFIQGYFYRSLKGDLENLNLKIVLDENPYSDSYAFDFNLKYKSKKCSGTAYQAVDQRMFKITTDCKF